MCVSPHTPEDSSATLYNAKSRRIFNPISSMRIFLTFLCFAFLAVVGYVSAQQFVTNNITQAEAVKLVSHLRLGMAEEDAARIMEEKNGLTVGGRVGCSHGWTRFYLLSNGCCLDLEMEPGKARADGVWADGRLISASIQCNCVKVLSIAVTNRP